MKAVKISNGLIPFVTHFVSSLYNQTSYVFSQSNKSIHSDAGFKTKHAIEKHVTITKNNGQESLLET